MRVLLLACIIGLLLAAAVLPPAKAPENREPAPPVRQEDHSAVIDYIKSFQGQAGVYAKNLKTGQDIQLNSDDIFAAASTNKLIVALAIYKYIYADVPQPQKQRYDQLILNMMKLSDNPAFYELLAEIERLQPSALTQVLTDLNLKDTRIHSGEAFDRYGYHSVTTPREMAIVFETIYNSQYLSPEASAILKEELAETIFQDEIPRHMQGSKVLHKVGELADGTLNDVGIVDDGRDQILISIFTKSDDPEQASNFMANLSAQIYDSLRSK